VIPPVNNHNKANSQAWVFLATCISGVLLFYPTLGDMLSMWWESGSAYSHGLLLMLIMVYFFIKQWNKDKSILSIRPKLWMLPVILSLSMLWMVSYLAQVQALEQLVLLMMLVSIIIALLGPARAVPYIYIVTLMIFTISSWSQINGFLQAATAVVTGSILDLTGFTSVREGYFILIPAGTFEVTGGCSGLNYQLAGLSISFLYAYLERFSLLKTVVYLLIASAVIFFANVVRIYIVILAGQFTQMKSPLIEDHLWLGWVVFSVFMGIFLYLSNRMAGTSEQDESLIDSPSSDQVEIAPVSKWIYTAVVLALTASGPVLARYYAPPAEYRASLNKLELPLRLNDWMYSSIDAKDQGWKPDFDSPDVIEGGRYRDRAQYSTHPVDYYMIIYAYQKQGHEAININNRVYFERNWSLTKKRTLTVSLANNKSIAVNEFEIRGRHGTRRLVWMWYYVDGKNLANTYKTKITSLMSVFRRRPEISVNIISSPIRSEPEPAREAMTGFLNSGLQEINALFDGWS